MQNPSEIALGYCVNASCPFPAKTTHGSVNLLQSTPSCHVKKVFALHTSKLTDFTNKYQRSDLQKEK
jgi:hypothetical protein